MNEHDDLPARLGRIRTLLREKLGARGQTLSQAMRKARHRLPWRLRRDAGLLARAEPLAEHPKLRLTLDQTALDRAATEIETHLDSIDIADRRKGWFLGLLGGLSFNLLLAAGLLILFLVWQGLI